MTERDRRTRLAEIRWIPASEGGRQNPPEGVGEPPYVPTVRLLGGDEREDDEIAWSLVIRKLEAGDDEGEEEAEWLAEIAFLVDAAPHDALTTGRRFELYEGARRVALGKILGFAGDLSVCSAMLEPLD